MPAIRPHHPNVYTGSQVNRAAHLRDDAAWLARALADPDSLWAPVWRGRSLLRGAEAALLTGGAAEALRMVGGPWTFLGLLQGRPLFALDVSAAEDPAPLLPDPATAFADLRSVAGALSAGDAAILAHARGMMHWRNRHLFCGHCGTGLEARRGGTTLHCPRCGQEHFPRTDPAVIMLVVCGEQALLAHSERFPSPTMYSTLAGFVEPGESLEEAVAREVFEEAGVRVRDVTYHSSQPWPFPASLMVGFYAEADDTTLVIDGDELTDARWFGRAEIRAPEAHGFSVPRSDSIARRLIEDWLAA